MGKLFISYLNGPRIFCCAECNTHLSRHDEILSKSFHGSHGRAYLFGTVINVTFGSPEDRVMTTGLHTVCDVFCLTCSTVIGWKYDKAFEANQKYKEGKFILEKALIVEVPDDPLVR